MKSKTELNDRSFLQNTKLSDQIKKSVEVYFETLEGEVPCDVYQLVLAEVEKPLLEVVMTYVEQNQTQASKILGVSRNTLRKKLNNYKNYKL